MMTIVTAKMNIIMRRRLAAAAAGGGEGRERVEGTQGSLL